ncbi:MAG TPA: GvpL/GvpF family gas vesicle protein [Vulgatibacter sp.]|nr:GvpL/GvpF family gas vesicle protein [Vulgatibacter sp.]
MSEALYVYGFVPEGDLPAIGAPGVDGASDVTTLPLGGIAAVVSPVADEALEEAAGGDRALDLDWVAPRALRHEQVVEEVMERTPVLPLTFGVIFSSKDALAAAVGPHRRRIAEFLDFVADKQEWAVKVYADARKIRERLEHDREGRAGIPDSPGARYLHQKRLARDLDRLAAEERSGTAERILRELSAGAVAHRSLRPSPRELTGRDDDMVLNAAFLEREGDVERFAERVRQLAEELGPRGFEVEPTGPWPPYSFCPPLQVQP